ncbi:uncharacterized protein LOC110092126 [Dendrobium catenatum]|uniref:Uncharacterized protein n=1 Tax=Dendrobium catenatum TaxID=906689 RepID=A0A2I0WQ45_9ASPA|nr:uncharacterized protein LOC110092126 [Dendrobium catenatum]PKU77789.1 hypothetical protein MA16_Dca005621 [Dendrobium catenatum]
MPTMTTALAIDGLFQYNRKESLAKKPSPSESRETAAELPASEVAAGPSAQRYFYSPALYATPDPGPIPDVSSIASSPNIYVVNHKRRDGGSRKAAPSRAEGFEDKLEADVLKGGDAIALSGILGKGKEKVEEEEKKKFVGWVGDAEIVEEVNDDFLDPQDSANAGPSGSDVEDGDSLRCGCSGNQPRSQDEYYDTAEDFFSDGSSSYSSPSVKRGTENELRLLKLSLIEESSKRKIAEENFLYLNMQFEKLLKCLSQSRSSSRESLNLANLKNEIDPTEICQEFVVLKHVSEALETDLAKGEGEEAFTEIIVNKNHEISRLRDRMMYYEAMNREMSQRNLEAVDQARKRRLRRQRMRKWIWTCVGLSITAGASLLAYSYLPHHGDNISSAPSSDSCTAITE